MKKKFSLWLNVVTICLCVCAIAIGVYAATSATLTVSGQVGFRAHGVEITVNGTLSGYVSLANIDKAETETKTLSEVQLNNDTKSMDIGEVYFTDLVGETVPNIVLTLNLTNTSKFKVRANVNTAALSNADVTATVDGSTTKSIVIDEDNGTATVTINFALNSAEDSIDALSLSSATLINFVKFTNYEQGELYVQNGRLYVEYGYYPTTEETISAWDTNRDSEVETEMYGENKGKAIRWVAIKDTTGATTNFTTLTSVPSSGNFYFVSEYAFDSHVFNTTYYAPVNGKNPNDYANSEIRAYLAGDFVTKYQLTSLINDTRLQARTLPTEEITNFVKTSGSYHADYAEGYITDDKANAIAGCQDKLWLLNADDEVSAVNTVMGSYIGYYPSQTDQVYNANFKEYGAYWWLRSPSAGLYYGARFVDDDGVVDNYYVDTACALRPAFQINLAV